LSIFKQSRARLRAQRGAFRRRVAAFAPMPDHPPRPDCLHCVHYFVTWDVQQPRGCRAYAFKSQDLPSDVVFASSGQACQLFERKPAKPSPPRLLR
jgi:hypothetical protein